MGVVATEVVLVTSVNITTVKCDDRRDRKIESALDHTRRSRQPFNAVRLTS